MIRSLMTVAALAAVTGLAACATPSNPALMTVPATPGLTASTGDTGYKSVATVNVSGGSTTNPLWTAQVSNADFKTALEASLDAAGYLGSSGPPITVDAALVELKQPLMGLDMSVTSEVRYIVTRDGHALFNEIVAATGTATLSEAFSGVERLKKANEKSIKENISEFLRRFRERAH